MNFTSSIFLFVCFLAGGIFHLFSITTNPSSRRRSGKRLPPGPFPLPIIGNMHQLGQNPHISLTKLSQNYGPLMHLKVGSVHTIVVSSPEMAKEILQKHDQAFPSRTSAAAARALDHHKSSVACLPLGDPKWRILRKICREQIFSSQRLDDSRNLRRENLNKLVNFVKECSVQGQVLDIGEVAFVTSLNLISNTLFSIDFAAYDSGSSQEIKGIVHGLMTVLGSFNLADYVPVLGLFDPQGIKGKAEFFLGKLLKAFDEIIDQRLVMKKKDSDSPKKNDLLEALLSDQSELSREDIKHLLLDLFVAGTDTTSGSVEWVMTELLQNPKELQKAKNELQANIGKNKQVDESDLSKLLFLQAVIKETFRYHPPGAFIVRRKDEEELELKLEINSYIIPKNAVVLINLWTMGRDPSVWSNPDSFEPNRFLNAEIDFRGHNFEFIPFGAGRRICPGLPLAERMVHLMVASLIHNFDWTLESGIQPEKLDIKEKFGLSLQKDVPLKAIPINVKV